MAHHKVVIETREVAPTEYVATVMEGPPSPLGMIARGYLTARAAYAALRKSVEQTHSSDSFDFLHAEV